MAFETQNSSSVSGYLRPNADHSFNSHNSSMQSDHLNSSTVSSSDVQKLSNNERVKYAIQKYVNEDQKIGVETEAALQRA